MFFERNGEYKFDSTKLGEAHKWCFEGVKRAIEDKTHIIIISNTSTRSEDVLRYKNLGEENGYKVYVLTVENWHGGSNIHNVPEEKLVNMENSLRNSMRLK
jgi:protein tyrosine phosphatase